MLSISYSNLTFWLSLSLTSEQFLAQDYHVLVHECEEEATIAGYTHFLPFQFTIPTLVATSNPDIHPLCKLLPPSITEGTVHIQRPNQIFAQPHIGYSLSASVHCHSNEHMSGPEQCFHVEAERVVVVLPFSSPKLLVGPEGELTRFKSSSKVDVSISHWFSRRLAEVEVSMLQPVTVTYGTQSHHTQNHVLIHLKLLLQGTQDPRKAPGVLLSRVSPRIHIKTIYSTNNLPSTSAKMDTNNPRTSTYKRCTSVKLPRHKEKLAWSLVSTSKEGEEGQRSDASQIWTSAISVPLHTPKPLPPTFCSALAARKYLLKVSLKLDGTRHETFELEAPLIIIYSGPRRTALDDSEVVRGRNNDEQLLIKDDKAGSFHVRPYPSHLEVMLLIILRSNCLLPIPIPPMNKALHANGHWCSWMNYHCSGFLL